MRSQRVRNDLATEHAPLCRCPTSPIILSAGCLSVRLHVEATACSFDSCFCLWDLRPLYDMGPSSSMRCGKWNPRVNTQLISMKSSIFHHISCQQLWLWALKLSRSPNIFLTRAKLRDSKIPFSVILYMHDKKGISIGRYLCVCVCVCVRVHALVCVGLLELITICSGFKGDFFLFKCLKQWQLLWNLLSLDVI